MPAGPWQHLASDLHGPTPSGDYVLVVTYEYSRFPAIEFVSSTSAKSVIPKLDKIFSDFEQNKEDKSLKQNKENKSR